MLELKTLEATQLLVMAKDEGSQPQQILGTGQFFAEGALLYLVPTCLSSTRDTPVSLLQW